VTPPSCSFEWPRAEPVALLRGGLQRQDAAARFTVGAGTIRKRRRSLYRKLTARSRHMRRTRLRVALLLVDPDPEHAGPSAQTTLGQVTAWERSSDGRLDTKSK